MIRIEPEPPNPSGLCLCGCGRNAPIAARGDSRRGVLKGHPTRFIHGHQKNRTRRPVEDRFWEKVAKAGEDECWPWQACINPKTGYGGFGWGYRMLQAHQASYILAHGSIPDDLCVLHTCDNRACVNPAHLYAGTHADNTEDKMRRGRHRFGSVLGSASPNAKIAEEDVRAIRALSTQGVSYGQLSRRFGIGKSQVFRIVKRKTWAHVT